MSGFANPNAKLAALALVQTDLIMVISFFTLNLYIQASSPWYNITLIFKLVNQRYVMVMNKEKVLFYSWLSPVCCSVLNYCP